MDFQIQLYMIFGLLILSGIREYYQTRRFTEKTEELAHFQKLAQLTVETQHDANCAQIEDIKRQREFVQQALSDMSQKHENLRAEFAKAERELRAKYFSLETRMQRVDNNIDTSVRESFARIRDHDIATKVFPLCRVCNRNVAKWTQDKHGIICDNCKGA